jgi:hypothetical protein
MKTNNQFLQEVYDLVGNEYTFLEEYQGVMKKILVQHNKCGHKYSVVPNSFLNGRRCPQCYGIKKKTSEIFKQEVYDLVKNEYIVLGKYMGANIKIHIKHMICNHEWNVTPHSFLRGNRCPKCNGGIKSNHDEFVNKVYSKYQDEYSVLGEYVRALDKILIRHNICGYEWDVTPNNLLRGYGCPECNKSKGEKNIRNFLSVRNIVFIIQYTYVNLLGLGGKNLSYDFYLPDYNLLIEFQGNYHDGTAKGQSKKEFLKQQEHDRRKKEFAKANNIKLLEIWYWDFDNIEEILNKELQL